MKQYTHDMTLRLTQTDIEKVREIAQRKKMKIAEVIRELIRKSK